VTQGARPAALRELPGRYFWRAAWPTVVVVVAAATLAQLTEGVPASAGVAVGGVIVLAFFGLDLLVMRITSGWDPAATFLVVMLEYLGKIIALAFVLAAIRAQDTVEGRWVGIGVAVAAVVFLGALVVAYLRIPTFLVEPADATPHVDDPPST
jgi:ATP synthase protein I